MAKSKHGEKSRAIRDYLSTHADAAANDVVAALAANGIKVSKQSISTVKGRMAAGPKKKKRGRKKGSVSAKTDVKFSIETLVQARRLAEQLGGVEKAREAMDALARLR